VLTRDPDLEQLPPKTPVSVKRLIRRCLERDPGQRLQWLGDARLELVDAEVDELEVSTKPEKSTALRLLPWAIAAIIAAVAIAMGLWDSPGAAPDSRQVRFTVPAPEGTVFHLEGLAPGPVALSPDGRRIAFTVRGVGGVIHLAVRDLDSVETRYLEEAEGAQYPFWSPDGTEIGFFTRSGAALKVIPADGGPVRTLCASRNGKGGSWNRDGVIVFTDDSNTPISAISADGGEPRELTTIDREAGENSHRHPQFLPDGQRFLYLARNVGGPDTHTVKVGSLDGGTDVEILRAPVAAAFVDGRLLYLRDRTLFARPFDAKSLELSGDEQEVVDDVMVIEGAARGVFSATDDVLVFQQGEEHTLGELVWLDRSGATVGRVGDVASYFSLAVSPDGLKVAVPVSNMVIGTNDIWICDVQRDLRSRVTFDDGEDLSPVWSSDGRQVYFVSNRSGELEVYRLTPGTTSEPELIVGGNRPMTPTSESPDGSRLLLTTESETAGSDLVILDLERGGDPQPFRTTRFNEDHATFSPDGRWVAYASDESGRFEIYLTSATADGRHWQVSTDGGLWPRWIAATGEILYQDTSGRFVVVSVRTGGDAIEIGDPEVLFGGYAATRLYQLFDPAPDGSKLLYRALSNEDPPEPPIVVVNWQGQGGPS